MRSASFAQCPLQDEWFVEPHHQFVFARAMGDLGRSWIIGHLGFFLVLALVIRTHCIPLFHLTAAALQTPIKHNMLQQIKPKLRASRSAWSSPSLGLSCLASIFSLLIN